MSDDYANADVEKGEKAQGNSVTLHGLDEGAPDGTVHRFVQLPEHPSERAHRHLELPADEFPWVTGT